MFSESLERLRKAFERVLPRLKRGTLGVRLMLGYALVFTMSAGLLFALAYALMLGFMREQDRALLESRLQAYTSIYAGEGLQQLRREVTSDAREVELLVRIANTQGRTRYLHNSTDLEPEDLAHLAQQQPLPEDENLRRVRARGEDDEVVEVAARRLPNGAVLQVGLSTDNRGDVLESFRTVFVAIALPVLLLGLLGGAFMAHRALRPVRDLLRTLETIADTGNLEKRVPADDARGAFGELTRLFNRMLGRIEALLTGMRETLDDAAHDLRTPMTRLRGRAELALQHGQDEQDYRDALADTLEASEQILTMLDTLLEVSEAEAGAMRLRLEDTAVADLTHDVAALYEFVASEKGVELEVSAKEDAHVRVDRSRMRQALANLLDNAVKYTPRGGHVSVDVRGSAREVRIRVHDSGIGISAEDLPRIWDRLYRGDRSRAARGMGLGLSLVKAVVEAHGGNVAAESEPGVGSTFTVHLPRAGTGENKKPPLTKL